MPARRPQILGTLSGSSGLHLEDCRGHASPGERRVKGEEQKTSYLEHTRYVPVSTAGPCMRTVIFTPKVPGPRDGPLPASSLKAGTLSCGDRGRPLLRTFLRDT